MYEPYKGEHNFPGLPREIVRRGSWPPLVVAEVASKDVSLPLCAARLTSCYPGNFVPPYSPSWLMGSWLSLLFSPSCPHPISCGGQARRLPVHTFSRLKSPLACASGRSEGPGGELDPGRRVGGRGRREGGLFRPARPAA